MTGKRSLIVSFSDQILSSTSNVFALMAVARVSNVDQFGTTALVYAIVAAAMALSRGSIGTPLLLLAGTADSTIKRAIGHSAATVGIFGMTIAGIIGICGTLAHAGEICMPLAIAIPFALIQDANRYGAIARGNPRIPLLFDGIWAAGSAALLVATWLSPTSFSPTHILTGWAALAIVSMLGAAVANGVGLRFRGVLGWLRVGSTERARYGLEAAVGAASALLVTTAAVLIIGTDAAAALRGASTIVGPLSVLITAVPLAVIPHTIRSGATAEDTWRLLRILASGMSILALLVGLSGIILPASIGQALLGPSWMETAPLLPFTGIEYAGVVWVACMLTALRAQGRSAALLRGRIALSTALATCSITGAFVWGTPKSMAAGLAIAAVAIAVTLVHLSSSSSERASKLGKKVDIRILT